ncbi:MAG: phosphatidate cytidylyltransferase [Gemmatimonadota bacterium]|jgi:phosphatidate cytidylyltransferase
MSIRELVKRLAVAALGIPLAVGIVYLGGWPLALPAALFSGLGARELCRLGKAQGVEAFPWLCIPGAVGLVLLAGLTRSYGAFAPPALALVLIVFVLSAVGAIWRRWPGDRPLPAVSLTTAGVLYLGGGLSFAVLLRHLPETPDWTGWNGPLQGPLLLLFPLAVTWTGDTAAYFFGHLFGIRRLIPHVSPGKTVTGAVAGLITSAITGAAMGWLALGLHPEPLASALEGGGLGFLLGLVSQVGDLVESVFKREAGVKDSGVIFPGHGGILDRFDALLISLPAAYVLIRLLGALR